MTPFRALLPDLELESLRQLACGAPKAPIPLEHGAVLVRGGFARVKAGALLVTTMGRAKLAFEITRASWLGNPARSAR